MSLEEEITAALDAAVSGLGPPRARAIDPRRPSLTDVNLEVIARVVEAQSDWLKRLAREIAPF